MDDLPKNKDRIQKFKETRDSQNIYESEQNKACFSHDVLMEILRIELGR